MVRDSLAGVDVAVMCLPADEAIGPGDRFLLDIVMQMKVPIVAAVATDEPEVAANSAQLPMLVCSRPPGRRPSQADSAMYMRSAMPERNSSSPKSTNSGIEVRRFSFCTPQTTGAIESMKGAP